MAASRIAGSERVSECRRIACSRDLLLNELLMHSQGSFGQRKSCSKVCKFVMAISDAGDDSHPVPGKFGGNAWSPERVMLVRYTDVLQLYRLPLHLDVR